jgi:CHASE2 domain-containing sensor protein
MVKRSLSLNSLLGGLIALAFIGLAYYSPPFMEQAERISYDTVTRLALPETPIDQRILLIEIHQKSLDELGSWPWPSDLIAPMVYLAKGSGAKVIGLNVPLLDEEKNAGLREAKIAGQLSHPSIVTIHDMGRTRISPSWRWSIKPWPRTWTNDFKLLDKWQSS